MKLFGPIVAFCYFATIPVFYLRGDDSWATVIYYAWSVFGSLSTALLTYLMFQINNKLIKHQTQPKLHVGLKTDPYDASLVHLFVVNVGNGLAKNIKFKKPIKNDIELNRFVGDKDIKLSEIGFINYGIDFLSHSDKDGISTYLLDIRNFGNKQLCSLNTLLEVEFEDEYGKKQEPAQFSLIFQQFENTSNVRSRDIDQNIQEIAKNIDLITAKARNIKSTTVARTTYVVVSGNKYKKRTIRRIQKKRYL